MDIIGHGGKVIYKNSLTADDNGVRRLNDEEKARITEEWKAKGFSEVVFEDDGSIDDKKFKVVNDQERKKKKMRLIKTTFIFDKE